MPFMPAQIVRGLDWNSLLRHRRVLPDQWDQIAQLQQWKMIAKVILERQQVARDGPLLFYPEVNSLGQRV